MPGAAEERLTMEFDLPEETKALKALVRQLVRDPSDAA